MAEEQAIFAKAARRLIPLMVALYTVSFLDRVTLGFAALTMNKDLGFCPEVYGSRRGHFLLGLFPLSGCRAMSFWRVSVQGGGYAASWQAGA
jgi:hypothetical protein